MADPQINAANFTDYASYLQNEQTRQAANDIATQEYNQAKLRGESEDRAQKAAELAWKKTYEEAGLTGYYQGQATMPTQQWWASNFGTWATPTPGQETMAREQQTFAQQQALANLYGSAYSGFGAVPQGQQTLTAQQQAFNQALSAAGLTGLYNGQQTQQAQQQAFAQALATQQEARAAQAQQQNQTQDYLKLLASLRGPADYAKYQQVLGSTPNGMRDLYAAAMGAYVPGGGATTGVNPQAVSLQSLVGDVSGNAYYGQGGGQLGTPNVYGQQGQGNALLEQARAAYSGGTATPYGPGTSTWTGGTGNGPPGYETQYQQMHNQQTQGYNQNLANQMAQAQAGNSWMPPAAGNGTNTMGAPQNQYNLPAPNQVAAQSWKNLAPSQQQLMLGEWENAGWNKDDVTALMSQALPRYGSNASTAGTWRL